MTRRLTIQIVLWALSATAAYAQDWRTCPVETFRDKLCNLVSRGNQQYDRSYRQGIKLYADSLQLLLSERQAGSTLERNDSIEFWAHWHKLWGDWFYEDGNYNSDSFAQSEQHFNEALQIFRQAKYDIFETKINAVPVVHMELAQLCYRLKRYDEALRYTQQAYDVYNVAINDNGEYEPGDKEYDIYLDLKSQLAICNARLGEKELALEQINSLMAEFPEKTSRYYEAARKKGKILMLLNGKNCAKQALPLYKEYLQWRMKDAVANLGTMTAGERQDYWMRTRPFIADCYQLENEDPSFLYDATLFAKGLLLQISRFAGNGKPDNDVLATLNYKWPQIQSRLASDACAIEFVQYEKDGEQKLAALVLKKTGKPQWVEMMSPKEFFGYENKLYGKTVEERIYTESSSPMEMKKLKNGLFNDSTLYSQVWNEQLGKHIGDCRKVYFAPDGYLHQVAVEYMIPEGLAAAQFYRLTSTRRLMDEGRTGNGAAMIIGGVNYQIASETQGSSSDNDQTAYNTLKDQPGRFAQLRNSLVECDSVLAARSCPRDTLIIGSGVTEAMFRELCNRYSIISISTHGLFCSAEIPQGTDVKPCASEESMSQSIIALAGVNGALDNERFNPVAYDGILSAYEMAAMDMSNVDLVVLSACQTGMGFVTSDGVFGIQRGLKNAGVGSIVASLWSVSDNATCQLMVSFHQNLRTGLSLHDAFMLARASLMETDDSNTAALRRSFSSSKLTGAAQRPADDTYDEPYFYNAFIMIDAIE